MMNMQNTNAVFVDEKKFKKVAKNLLNKLNKIENPSFKLNSVQELLAESLGFRNYTECKKLLSQRNNETENIEKFETNDYCLFKNKIKDMTIFQQQRMFKIQESDLERGAYASSQIDPYILTYLILANMHTNIKENENFKTYYLFKDKNKIYSISHLLNFLTNNNITNVGYEILHDIKYYINNYQENYLFLSNLNRNIENSLDEITRSLTNPNNNNITTSLYLKSLLNLEKNYSDTLIYHSRWFTQDENSKSGYFYNDKITNNEFFYNSWLEMAEYKELVNNLLRIGVDKMTLTDLLIFMAKTVDSAKIEKLLSIYKQLNKNIEIVTEISQFFIYKTM